MSAVTRLSDVAAAAKPQIVDVQDELAPRAQEEVPVHGADNKDARTNALLLRWSENSRRSSATALLHGQHVCRVHLSPETLSVLVKHSLRLKSACCWCSWCSQRSCALPARPFPFSLEIYSEHSDEQMSMNLQGANALLSSY
eukprot:6118406-Amphidinium_carterae.3